MQIRVMIEGMGGMIGGLIVLLVVIALVLVNILLFKAIRSQTVKKVSGGKPESSDTPGPTNPGNHG